MLYSADADLVRRDPALPGLATLLDGDAFGDLLERAVPDLAATRVRPVYIRYKPGTRCLVSYEVTAAGATMLVHATAYTAERDLPGKGVGRVVAGEGISISRFPDDEVLESLARLWNSSAGSRLLRKVLPGRPALWRGTLGVLAYKPGRRCVAVLRGANGVRATLKAYTASGFAHARAGSRAFRSAGPLRVARVVGRSRRHSLLAFEWLPGDRLVDLLSQRRADVACLRRVGAALAALHRQPGRGLNDRGRTDVESLTAVARGIGFLCPGLGDRAARLAVALGTRLEQLALKPTPIHGDFYHEQVLVAPETINVIDLDRASLDDPRIDVGNFIAHLDCDTLVGRLGPSEAGAFAAALLDGYADIARDSWHDEVNVHVAAALLRLAPRPFRTRQPDWTTRTAAILDRAESLLGTTGVRRTPSPAAASAVSDPFDVRADGALSVPPDALDPKAMGRRLQRLAPFRDEPGPLEVRAVRVSRHKPGRRCLIEYDVSVAGSQQGPQTLVGKVRAKGADRGTYRLSRALWRFRFGEDSPDGISIPTPIGVLPDLKMWLQLKVQGVPSTMLLRHGDGREVGERAAEAIRKLHCSDAKATRSHGTQDELRILRDRLLGSRGEMPRWRARLDSIVEACTRVAASLADVAPRGLHRDFHPDQMLVDDGRVYLLDLDLYAAGDPALDVGNFLAHVTEYSLRAFGDPDRLAPCEAAMKERFLALDRTASERAVEIYKTLTLARHIQISTLFPDRQPSTERLLELVEARLACARAGRIP